MDPTQLDETTREAMRETIIAATPELAHAKQRLDQAQSQLDEQKAQTEQTLKTKENELKTSIPQVRWYVQDRQSLGGFSALKSDLDSIQSLGNAFPIVFLVVAVMMSLTSMARMSKRTARSSAPTWGLAMGVLRWRRAICCSRCWRVSSAGGLAYLSDSLEFRRSFWLFWRACM